MRRGRIAAAALALVVSVGLVAPAAPASALPIVQSARLVSSKCSGALDWSGVLDMSSRQGYGGAKVPPNVGKVTFCTYKYVIDEADKTADYYLMDMSTTWTTAKDFNPTFAGSSPLSVSVSSNTASFDNMHRATPTFKTGKCQQIDVSFSWFVGVSVPVNICGATITRNSLSTTGASWSGSRPESLKSFDVAYAQKVKPGKVPTYSITFKRPTYSYSWKLVRSCRGGSCWDGWVIDKALTTTSSITYTR